MDASTTEAKIQANKILLIDLENCPSQIHQLMANLEDYVQVVICYAQSGAKIPIDWILPLTAMVNSHKLKIAKMPTVGKNAADFGIAFWAGMLIKESPQDTYFEIVSNDNDLEHVVNLLNDQGRNAVRIGMKKEPAQLPANDIKDGGVHCHYAQEYCRHLLNHDKNRPVKKETLLNSIKGKFKLDAINPELVFDTLSKQGVVAVKDNKILYNANKIAQIASL